MSPGDTYARIEGAGPGDEVVIAPGRYAFRVYLTAVAPVDQPIVSAPLLALAIVLVLLAPGRRGAGSS